MLSRKIGKLAAARSALSVPKPLRRGMTWGTPLVLSGVLALAMTGSAYANTVSVTVYTPGATLGPTSADSQIVTDGECGSGLISGGGIDQAIGTGMSSNGNHVLGTEPSSDGSTQFTGTPGVVATDVAYWLGVGGSGGMVDSSFSSTPYALCFTSNLINHTQVVMNDASGPSTGTAIVTATCPSGTVLLGGGGLTTPASVGSLKPDASFPTYDDSAHDFGKIAAADGATNPNAWTAVGQNGGGSGTGNETYAYAICSGSGINVSGVTVTVRFSEISGPTTATTGETNTVACGSSDGNLISGGAAISGGNVTTTDFTESGSQGDHLNGSYPSDASGNPVSNGTTSAADWTAYTHTGGSASSGTYTDVWALCANDGV